MGEDPDEVSLRSVSVVDTGVAMEGQEFLYDSLFYNSQHQLKTPISNGW